MVNRIGIKIRSILHQYKVSIRKCATQDSKGYSVKIGQFHNDFCREYSSYIHNIVLIHGTLIASQNVLHSKVQMKMPQVQTVP